jgi:HlyD family secretion protein
MLQHKSPSAPHCRAVLQLLTTIGVLALSTAQLAAAQDKPARIDGAKSDAAKVEAGKSGTARAALTVNLVAPQLGQWPQTLAANGNISAWQEAVIGAEAAGLRLTEVLVNVGDRVKRGQLLARLKSDTLAADLAATRAALAEAMAAADEARANADRARQLQPTGVISLQQITQWLTGEATARARVDALRARLTADELRLAQTRVTASDDGLISARSATVGGVVQPGQELFRLIRGARLEWRAEVPASDLLRLKPGLAVKVTPAGGTTLVGKLRMVAPTVDAATRNGIVFVDLPQAGDARAGMFARGEFEFGSSQGMTLPQSALLLRDGFSYVFRVGADAKAVLTKVSVGRRVGDRVEITGGLDASAQVVAAGAGFLSDGDTVRVVNNPVAAIPAAAPPR